MCHSVEMYMPQLARQAAEHRLGKAGAAFPPRPSTAGLLVRIAAGLRALAARRPALRPSVGRPVETLR